MNYSPGPEDFLFKFLFYMGFFSWYFACQKRATGALKLVLQVVLSPYVSSGNRTQIFQKSS